MLPVSANRLPACFLLSRFDKQDAHRPRRAGSLSSNFTSRLTTRTFRDAKTSDLAPSKGREMV
jgi:hypothetical protein